MRHFTVPTMLLQPMRYGVMGVAALAMVVAGCATGTKIAHNAKGSVYLEEITDWSFEANHPAVIDQMTMAKIIKGLYSDDSQSGSSRMSAGGSKSMRIFSDEDAEFLSPLLAQGLSKAKPEQVVGFRVSSSAGSGSEPTTGSIYVQKGSIYVNIAKGAKASGFMPESVARTEQVPAYITGGVFGGKAMVIDYHALAKSPMPAALPFAKTAPKAEATPIMAASSAKAQTVSASGSQEIDKTAYLPERSDEASKIKQTLAKKETEIRVLRRESDWMKRELRERNEEIKALKASTKAAPKKKKSAQAAQTRSPFRSADVQ